MKNNKTKTLVLVILGVALIAVGAFQFIPKGGGTASVEKASVKKSAHAQGSESASSKGSDGGTTQASQGNGVVGATNGEVAKNDADPQKAALQSMVKEPLPARDPFAPQAAPVVAAPTTETTPPVQQTHPPVNTSSARRPGALQGGVRPWVPPLENGLGGNPAAGPVNLTQGAPLRQPYEFAYKVKGVIVGNKPMAVFEDDNGNQRLVPLGGSVDGDSKVVGIEKGKVRIRHRGKDQTLDLPEGP